MTMVRSIALPTGGSVMQLRHKTLIANMDTPVMMYQPGLEAGAGSRGNLALVDLNPASALATGRVGGSVSAGDTVTITLTQATILGSASPLVGTYTVVTADTLMTIAGGVAQALNDAAVAAGVRNLIEATTQGLDVVVTYLPGGPAGNLIGITKTAAGSATLTLSGSTLTGGAGSVLATQSFTIQTIGATRYQGGSGNTLYFREGIRYLLGDDLVAQLIAAGMPIQ